MNNRFIIRCIAGNYTQDLDDQGTEDNYEYDAIGNLIEDKKENIQDITWNVSGKVTLVVKTDGSSLEFKYDPMGHRCEKVFTDVEGKVKRSLYVRDAQGNMLSVYGYKAVNNEAPAGGVGTENAWLAYLYARSLEVKKNPTDASLYLRDSLLGRIGGVWNMANGTALFNAIYAQNWLGVVNLVAGVNDPDRGNNQGGLYGKRELGAMLEEFIYMYGWKGDDAGLSQRRTVQRTLVQTEAHLYGSSRLGVDKMNRRLLTQKVDEIYMPFNKRWVFLGLHTEEGVQNPSYIAETPDSLYFCVRGLKRYEFSNHLGNVMTTLTDRRVWSANPDRWVADAVSGQDYDPFGMVRPNRSVSEDGYRFGFNGKEKDSEFSNESYDFGARIYDGRVARWLACDPKSAKYPSISPYAAFGNCPVFFTDPGGETLNVSNSAFLDLKDALDRTLGPGHGLSMDYNGYVSFTPKPNVQVPVPDPSNHNNIIMIEQSPYSPVQQEIVNRLAYVINYTGVANVREAGKMDPICDDNGCTSLQKREENGVTFTLTNTKNDILNFEVVIASAPTEFVKQNPVRKTEFDKNGIPTTKYEEQLPIEVMLPEYYKGVATIHEVLGHVYLRTTQPNLSNSEHNRKVEKFETEIRQIYKIGNHDIKSAKKNKVKEGDPKYLKGSSDRHKE